MNSSALFLVSAILAAASQPSVNTSNRLPGFHRSAWFQEQVQDRWIGPDVRVRLNAPEIIDPTKPTRLVIYATPNGNTIEQTLGARMNPDTDWHFDIQHVAAQIRKYREISTEENVILACVEAEGLSWPTWKRAHSDAPQRVREIVETLKQGLPGREIRLTLTGHSGGGSFLFAYIDAADTIPDDVEQIAFLDANYSYSDADRHGDKLLSWLNKQPSHRLAVLAYDDRNITLNGKKVIGPEVGTFRATQRMLSRFARDLKLNESTSGPIRTSRGGEDRVRFHVHLNPDNRILHTALVGEMNGLLEVLTYSRGLSPDWGKFGGPRAYTKWIQPAPGLPPRPAQAMGGVEFFATLAKLNPTEREEAIAREAIRGNIPNFLRRFHTIPVRGNDSAGKVREVKYEVMPDEFAIGSDSDFVRVPMTPMTAQRIAEAFGCALPTRKMVNDIYQAAEVKLAPKPLTELREDVKTFLQHHQLIEKERGKHELGKLVAGIKKNIVITNRLAEKPNRVAIYGWHKLDGSPIQPLTIVHRDTYVDYSHGVRFVKRTIVVDGRPRDLWHALHSAELSDLLSDEGPISRPSY